MIKFIKRNKDGLINSVFGRPQAGCEQIDSESAEFKAYENKTGKYEVKKTPVENRIEEYGSPAEQLEYIVENGIEAFIAKQEAVK
ncbi:MAG: hypothetical protein DRO67_05970, partial [Candidatus Asgardarchaeum californiense]